MASLLIPRAKEMPIDHLREIVLSLKEVPTDYTHKAVMIIKTNRLDSLFSKLSNDQIKSIFTRPFEMKDYLDLLINTVSTQIENPEFNPAPTLRQLIVDAPVTDVIKGVRLYHKELNNLRIPDYRVKLLLSKNDFTQASQDFINCVKSYHSAQSQDCFVVSKDDVPKACVRVHNKKIVEVSGVGNKPISQNLYDLIQNSFNLALSK